MSNAQFFSVLDEFARFVPSRAMASVGPSMTQSKDPELQKEYLELGDEELTPVMPSEMEKIIRELPRDTEIQSSRFSKESVTNG